MEEIKQILGCSECGRLVDTAHKFACEHTVMCNMCATSYFLKRAQFQCPHCLTTYLQSDLQTSSLLTCITRIIRKYGFAGPNSSAPSTDPTPIQLIQPVRKTNIFDRVQFTSDDEKQISLDETTTEDLSDSVQSMSEEEMQSDISGKPVQLCPVCKRHVRRANFIGHSKQCTPGSQSQLGLAKMQFNFQNAPKPGQQVRVGRPRKILDHSPQPIAILPMAGISPETSIKRIKTDLVKFGFGLTMISQLSEQQLREVYQKTATRYNHYTSAPDISSDEGIKNMIIDDFIKSIGKVVQTENEDVKQWEMHKLFRDHIVRLLEHQDKGVLLKIRQWLLARQEIILKQETTQKFEEID